MSAVLPDGWSADELSRLKELWAEGLSVSEIAFRLGCGKGRVSGKVDRLRAELGFRNGKAAARNEGRMAARRWVDERRSRASAPFAGCRP